MDIIDHYENIINWFHREKTPNVLKSEDLYLKINYCVEIGDLLGTLLGVYITLHQVNFVSYNLTK